MKRDETETTRTLKKVQLISKDPEVRKKGKRPSVDSCVYNFVIVSRLKRNKI